VNGQPTFSFPKTDCGKRQFLLEVETMTTLLNALEGVRPWEFAATSVIGRELEFSLLEGPKLPEVNPALQEPDAQSEVVGNASEQQSTTIEIGRPRLDDNKENGSAGPDDELVDQGHQASEQPVLDGPSIPKSLAGEGAMDSEDVGTTFLSTEALDAGIGEAGRGDIVPIASDVT
jgi:hypothetical protein